MDVESPDRSQSTQEINTESLRNSSLKIDQNRSGRSSRRSAPKRNFIRSGHSSRFRRTAAVLRLSHHSTVQGDNAGEDNTESVADEDILHVKVRSSSKVTPDKIEEVRGSLKKIFQTPFEKWETDKKFPFKLLLQLLKVFVVTWQLATFFGERATFENFSKTNRIAFHHVFLKGWGSELETLPYPPASGDYALYTQEELYDHMNFVLYQYYGFEELTLTSLRPRPSDSVMLDISYFAKAELDPIHQSYKVDSNRKDVSPSIKLPRIMRDANCTDTETPEKCYRIKQFLKADNQTIEIRRIIDMKLTFSLHGINVKVPETSISQPTADVECVIFKITIKYDNSKGSGQFLVKLSTELDMTFCKNERQQNERIKRKNTGLGIGLTVFDIFVICVCVISLSLALRSLFRRRIKMKSAKALFREHYGVRLTIPEITEFMTLWYFQYITSDILVLTATVIKIYLKYGYVAFNPTFDNVKIFNAAAIMLGLANWSQWIGLIRFLGYSNRYYTLILTITNAVPALIRFLVCGSTIFLGYLFSGWIILGPYNQKFETISAASQTLFSLINGDEIYATMSIINESDHPTEIWIFSCLYLYSYIILFIFAIANLFIAVITDSYENIKSGGGYQKTFLHHFVDESLIVTGTTESDKQRVFEVMDEDETDQQYGVLAPFLCCLDRCVHHNTNTRIDEDDDGDLRRNSVEMNHIEDNQV